MITWNVGQSIGLAVLTCCLVTGGGEMVEHRSRSVSADDVLSVVAPDWVISHRDGRVLEATHRAPVTSVTTPFDSVQIGRVIGGRTLICTSLQQASMLDNGVARAWVYRIQRPRGGPCAGTGVQGFLAIGFKGAGRTATEPMP